MLLLLLVLEFIQIIQRELNKVTIPNLIGLLFYDNEGEVRAMASLALAGIGQDLVLPILLHLLKDIDQQDPVVLKYISEAIEWIKGNKS